MNLAHNRRRRAGPAPKQAWTSTAMSLALSWSVTVALMASTAWAAEAGEAAAAAMSGPSDTVMMWGFLAAAHAVGLTALGAAYAVSHVGAAALGTMGERPEISGRALIFLGLAEGIAIYGLIIAIMILGRLG